MSIPAPLSSFDRSYKARLESKPTTSNSRNKQLTHPQNDRYIRHASPKSIDLSDMHKQILAIEMNSSRLQAQQICEEVTGYHFKNNSTSYFTHPTPIHPREEMIKRCITQGLAEEKRTQDVRLQKRISSFFNSITHTSVHDEHAPANYASHNSAKGRSNDFYFCHQNTITRSTLDTLVAQPVYRDPRTLSGIHMFEQGAEHMFFGRSNESDEANDDQDYHVRSILDVETGTVCRNYEHADPMERISSLTSDGPDLMYAGNVNGWITRYDRRGKFVHIKTSTPTENALSDHSSLVINSLAISPNKNLLAAGTYSGKALIYDVRKTQRGPLHELTASIVGLRGLCWSPDGDRLLTGGGSEDKTMRLFDISKPSTPLVKIWKIGSIFDITFLSHQLFTVTGGIRPQVWHYKDHTSYCIGSLKHNDSPRITFNCLYYPQAHTLITTENTLIRRWNMHPLMDVDLNPVVIKPITTDTLPMDFNLR